MRRWFSRATLVVALLLGALAAPTLAIVVGQTSTAKQDPQTITVYVTLTGAKYHRDGCRYLSRSKIPMSLKEAVKKYTPCSVCKPPVLK